MLKNLKCCCFRNGWSHNSNNF